MSGEWKREVGYVGKTPEYWDSESGYHTHPRHSSTLLACCYLTNQGHFRVALVEAADLSPAWGVGE